MGSRNSNLAPTYILFCHSPQSNQLELIKNSAGYYSAKSKVTTVPHGIDKMHLSLALGEFMQQRLSSNSPSSPVIRVKDLFILAHYYKSTEAGAREPAFSVQVATNTDYTNRILVDVRINPQSVAYRALHIPSNYLLEEEEEPLRCVVLPSMKSGMVKARHDRPPDDCDKPGWFDFVDYYERYHKLHLPDEMEDRCYATVVINNSSDPNRFMNVVEDVVPVAMLWTESGLSRRDLHGAQADLTTAFVLDRILAIRSKSGKPTQIDEADEKSQEENVIDHRLLYPLLPGSFADIATVKNEDLVEKKKKEVRERRTPGFIKSSQCSTSQSFTEESSVLDTSISTDASASQQTQGLASQPSQIDTQDPFSGAIDLVRLSSTDAPTLADVIESLKSAATSSYSLGPKQTNVPVRLGVSKARLGARVVAKSSTSPAGAAFTPPVSQNAHSSDDSPMSSSQPNSPNTSSSNLGPNLKKRKVSPLASKPSPIKAFQPPRPKIAKS